MAAFLNRSTRYRKITPVTPSRKIETTYREILVSMTSPMLNAMALAFIGIDEKPDVRSTLALLRGLESRWDRAFDGPSNAIADAWSRDVSAAAKTKLEQSIGSVLGKDIIFMDDPDILASIELSAKEASDLIRTIPKDYLGKVSQAVVEVARSNPLPENRTLSEEIAEIGKITMERAELIAKDQTSKMNTAINQIRQTSVGIEEYYWRTREDNRVVGDPGGLYPKGNKVHGNHYIRNGLLFRWDEPPPDGHPGYAINCRCKAIPRLNRNNIEWVGVGYRQK